MLPAASTQWLRPICSTKQTRKPSFFSPKAQFSRVQTAPPLPHLLAIAPLIMAIRIGSSLKLYRPPRPRQSGNAQLTQKTAQHLVGIEIILGEAACGPRVARVVAAQILHGLQRFVQRT